MNQVGAIKKLALANLILLPVTVVLGFYFESKLPTPLVDYLEQELERDTTNIELVVALISFLVVVAHFAALIGVLFTKRWSRITLLFSSAFLFLLAPYFGPYVSHGLTACLDSLSSVMLGALLALLFFGEPAFNKLSQKDAASGASA